MPGQHDDDESGDEIDQLSTRTLALARYKRNHDWMNEVFCQAAFGKVLNDGKSNIKDKDKKKTPYSIFSKTELEGKVVSTSLSFFLAFVKELLANEPIQQQQATLQKEIESLQTISALRRAEKVKAAQELGVTSIGVHGDIGSVSEAFLVT